MRRDTERYDVVVVGAGVAGVTAAIASARLGAKTLLMEASDQAGGCLLEGMHAYVCGLYRNDPDAPFDVLNQGLVMEIVRRMDRVSGTNARRRLGRVEVHACRARVLANVLMSMVAEERNIETAFSASAQEVLLEGNRIAALAVRGRKSRKIRVRRIVDASGQGRILSQCSGAWPGWHALRQMCASTFRIEGVRFEEFLPVVASYAVRKGVAEGTLPSECTFTTFTPDVDGGSLICRINISVTDWRGRYKALHSIPPRLHAFLVQRLGEFRNSAVTERCQRVLDRDGPRLNGVYVLRGEDVLRGHRFHDGVVKAAWPVEFWYPGKGPKLEYPEAGAYYEIPARALRSREVSNLFAAGNCISADCRAHASLRVTGTCMATGEAAAREALKP